MARSAENDAPCRPSCLALDACSRPVRCAPCPFCTREAQAECADPTCHIPPAEPVADARCPHYGGPLNQCSICTGIDG